MEYCADIRMVVVAGKIPDKIYSDKEEKHILQMYNIYYERCIHR